MLLGIFQGSRLVVPFKRTLRTEEVISSTLRLMRDYGVGVTDVITLKPGRSRYTDHYLLRMGNDHPVEVVAGPFGSDDVPSVVEFDDLPAYAQYGDLETYHVSESAI